MTCQRASFCSGTSQFSAAAAFDCSALSSMAQLALRSGVSFGLQRTLTNTINAAAQLP